ncbi:MAG: hypothetical protein K9N46_07490 [Candidatus Marinimicrobia bacterium]|nr:hypothetical protein [Candidatus Neomarinimicrobiota bacterium]MCF7880566.1 hypothetical protein [Candidatus Neomarinimicrobiota bacterium]
MGKKQITGLCIDGPNLRVAVLEQRKNQLHLVKLKTVEFQQPVMAYPFEESVPEPVEAGIEEENPGDFSFEEASNGAFESESAEDDLFDLEAAYDDADVEVDQDTDQLVRLLQSLDSKKHKFAMSLPLGSTIIHPIERRNFQEAKKKEIRHTVEERIKSVYEPSEANVQYAYDVQDDGQMLLVSREGEIPQIEHLDRVAELQSSKIHYETIHPDEAGIIGLVRTNYDLAPGTISAIVHTGFESSRIIFLRGKEVLTILPLIHRGQQSDDVVQACLSKILLELDQNNLPGLHQIIMVNGSLRERHFEFIQDHLPEVTLEPLKFDPELIQIDGEHQQQLRFYLPAIAAAWKAQNFQADDFPVLSLIPDRIRERQKTFKLAWHGMVLLLLIALTPILFNKVYQDKMTERQQTAQQAMNAWRQAEISRPFVSEVDALVSSISSINADMEMLDTLSIGSKQWTRDLSWISEAVESVNSCWIDKMVTVDDEVIIEGFARYRNRVPRLAAMFSGVEIKEVVEVSRRDVQVYKFILRINDITKAPESLEMDGNS